MLEAKFHHGKLEIEYANHYWTYVHCPVARPFDIAHLDSIVIAVKCICRGNGQYHARGAIALYYGDGHPANEGTENDDAYTCQRADLHAALAALQDALDARRRNKQSPVAARGPWRKLRRLVIKSHSMYLVEAMIEHIDRWNANGLVNAKGQDVVNEDLFRQVDDLIDELNDESDGPVVACAEERGSRRHGAGEYGFGPLTFSLSSDFHGSSPGASSRAPTRRISVIQRRIGSSTGRAMVRLAMFTFRDRAHHGHC